MSALLELDVRTILLLLVAGNLAAAATLVAHTRRGPYEPAAGRYLAGALCQAAAWTLLFLRGRIPAVLSIQVGNTSLIVGFCLQCLALDGAYRPDARLDRRYAVIALAGIALFLAFADRGDHVRVAVASFATMPPFFALGLSMLRMRGGSGDSAVGRERGGLRIFIGLVSGAYALVLAARGSAAVVNGVGVTLLAPSVVQTMAFVPLFIFSSVATIGFTMLSKERSDARLAESEEKYRTLVDKAGEAIAIIQDGRFVFANPRLGELVGASADDMVGRPMGDYIWPEDRAMAEARHASRVAALGTFGDEAYDLRIVGADGEPRWIAVYATVIQWKGRPASLGLLTDIDDRKRQEARVAELLADREALLREVHHRVKNNLTVVTSLLSLQASQAAGRDPETVLDDARNRLQSMMQLYDLLNAKGEFRQASVGEFLGRLVREIVAVYPEAERTRFVLELDDWTVDADRLARIGIIVNELITNSMKYAFDGVAEPTVTIRSARDGELVRLEVSDNGKGLKADAPAEGLGLRLVAMLARQLGAGYRVDGAAGARYEFRLPA